MGESISPEQVKKKYVDSFPSETGDLFHKLWNDVALLHFYWKSYKSLYGTSPERIELLNRTASQFFRLLEPVLRNDILLRITRPTDRAKTGSKTNMSLEFMIDKLKPHIKQENLTQIDMLFEELKRSSYKVSKLRNVRIAHKDLSFSLDESENIALGISRDDIENLLKSIRILMGNIEKYFTGTPTSHEHILTYGDAESLIYALEQARKYDEEMRRKYMP